MHSYRLISLLGFSLMFALCVAMQPKQVLAQSSTPRGLGSVGEEAIEPVSSSPGENGAADGENTSLAGVSDKTFWSTHVDTTQDWGAWLKEQYKPYADKLTVAMLKIVASTAEITYEGKSSEEILAEINAAYSKSLRSMELINPPAELKQYHQKLVQLYRFNINADPNNAVNNALETQKLTIEVDKAMTKALLLRGVPQNVIDYINQN